MGIQKRDLHELQKDQLCPGMVIAEDVFNYAGQLVVPLGTILTDYIITKLEYYSVLRVKVLEDVLHEPPQTEQPVRKTSETIEFKIFKEEYEEDVLDFRCSLNDIVERNAPVNVSHMYEEMQQLVNNATGLNILDMVQNLRQYDDSTYAHAVNVSLICHVLAKWLDFSEEDIKMATMCGLLHDIGKLKVPSEIIKKPGKLTVEEFAVIKQHTVEGYKILLEQDVDWHVRYSALMHHEKCDGSGYPCGLQRNQIDPFAKLVAIADIYDAMTAKRVYRGPICPFEVIRIFEEEGLNRYETSYIMTFLQRVADTYMNADVRLSDGRVGKVIYINKMQISGPTVQCQDELVDLTKAKEIKVEQML